MNDINDPRLKSFIQVPPESHFPIQNLPFGVFRPRTGGTPRVGAAIGDFVVDLAVLEREGLLNVSASRGADRPRSSPAGASLRSSPGHASVFDQGSLNAFMARGRQTCAELREALSRLLRDDEPRLRDDVSLRERAIVPMAEVAMLLPAEIGDYTDFYSSREHATNVGAMLRGLENALMPNWLHLPVAYHGRASSIVVSGADIRRPNGQTKSDLTPNPAFGPSRSLDFELELGVFIGMGNDLGQPIPIDRAAEHLFGLVLVNDWSARDIQKWEYVPLGPFLAKNFATSISPWVVTLDALEPFRVAGPVQDPPPLPYLRGKEHTSFDIQLEVWLQTQGPAEPLRICSSNARNLYWSFAQQTAHHASNGCNLRTGDLLATGTISGSAPDARGCLLEITQGGRNPIALPGGGSRRFLEDGDRITITGFCQGAGYRIGFGEVTGQILPALRN